VLDLLRQQARAVRDHAERLVRVLEGTASLYGEFGPRKAGVELSKMLLTLERLTEGPELEGREKRRTEQPGSNGKVRNKGKKPVAAEEQQPAVVAADPAAE
jgi:hypothetical protein